TNSIYLGGSTPGTSQLFKVETGLLILTAVNPIAVSGQQGDMVTRTVTLQNTRQGPISALSISDLHQPGISVEVVGLGGANVTAQLFQVDVPGSAFTAIGDGDALLEFGEELVLTQKITITKCSPTPTSVPSLITAGWGCDGSVCQRDSINAEVQIVPSTKNPKLAFFPKYTPPRDFCGEVPSTQELIIVNQGDAATDQITLLIFSQDTFHLGVDPNSFEYNTGSGWMSVPPGNGVTRALQPCNKVFNQVAQSVMNVLVDVGDTLRVRYNTYFCAPQCYDEISFLSAAYSYRKACPTTQFISGNFNFFPKVEDVFVASDVEYELESCMVPGNIYDLTYWVRSKRQMQDTGYFHIYFDLPRGLEWTGTCDPILDGKAPLSTEVTQFATFSRVKLVYKLPFSMDSIGSSFCVRYVCIDNPNCTTEVPNPPPPGGSYTVFPTPPDCKGCNFVTSVVSGFAVSPQTSKEWSGRSLMASVEAADHVVG
ncbi:MAG TPA: hypothetical protein PK858_08570, partial [Saprospiraceae bacterium]|nr:hypothetical protein [Saprospiraceae bacterium]